MENREITILIAEDEKFNRMYMEELFLNTPFEIITAINGQKAIELFQEHSKIDLVLMDIKMPKVDGIKAMQTIKKMNPNTPVIALSAMVMEFENEGIIEKGFDGYLSKPIDRIKLFELIDLNLCK